MGRRARHKPRRLGKKLQLIRQALGLSQNQMLVKIGLDEKYTRNNLSNYELDVREAPLDIVLGYARVGGMTVEMLVDDKVELPKRKKRVASKT